MACILAAGVQQRLHQSNFFTKEYKEISWSFARESCLITKTTVKCFVQKASYYSSSKRLCTLDPILSILGRFHIHTRRDSHCCEAAVWKHRGSPLLRIMFLAARNGGTTERQRWWPKLWLGLHVTPWVLSRLPLLQDYLGSLPSCKNSILAPSPTITKELEIPNLLWYCPSPAAQPFHTSHVCSALLRPFLGTEPRSPRCSRGWCQSSQWHSAWSWILYWQQRLFNLQQMVHLTGLTTSRDSMCTEKDKKSTQIVLLLFSGGLFWFVFAKASYFAAHQHCLSILHNVFFSIKMSSVSSRKKVFSGV